MKYRHLKEFSKSGLIVKCSQIHGRGLFTLVDLHQSQMIIEYSGEIIRHQLCDKREKHYETKVNILFIQIFKKKESFSCKMKSY